MIHEVRARGSDDSSLTSILVLGTAEWNAPIATNQHYVVRELAKSPDVTIRFMESMALRRPKMTRRDLVRIFSRLPGAVRQTASTGDAGRRREIPDRVTVRSTMVIPTHTGLPATFNYRLLRRQVKEWLEFCGRRILFTYTPVTYGLEGAANACIYHCVELLAKVEGIDADLVDAEERRLSSKGVSAIATSEAVIDRLAQVGFSAPILIENVADMEVYGRLARPPALARALSLPGTSPPPRWTWTC